MADWRCPHCDSPFRWQHAADCPRANYYDGADECCVGLRDAYAEERRRRLAEPRGPSWQLVAIGVTLWAAALVLVLVELTQ